MGFTSKTMAEAAVRRLLPKDEHIVMAWIGGVVGIVGLSKLTSKTPPQSVPVASGSSGMEDLFKQYPELQSALGTSSAPEPVVDPNAQILAQLALSQKAIQDAIGQIKATQ